MNKKKVVAVNLASGGFPEIKMVAEMYGMALSTAIRMLVMRGLERGDNV